MFLSQNRTQTMRKKSSNMQESSQSPLRMLLNQIEDDYSVLGYRYHLLNGTGHLAHLAHAVLAATSREYLY